MWTLVPIRVYLALNVDEQNVDAVDFAGYKVSLPNLIQFDYGPPTAHLFALCSRSYRIPESRSNDSRLVLAPDTISLCAFAASLPMKLARLATAESARGAHFAIHRSNTSRLSGRSSMANLTSAALQRLHRSESRLRFERSSQVCSSPWRRASSPSWRLRTSSIEGRRTKLI